MALLAVSSYSITDSLGLVTTNHFNLNPVLGARSPPDSLDDFDDIFVAFVGTSRWRRRPAVMFPMPPQVPAPAVLDVIEILVVRSHSVLSV